MEIKSNPVHTLTEVLHGSVPLALDSLERPKVNAGFCWVAFVEGEKEALVALKFLCESKKILKLVSKSEPNSQNVCGSDPRDEKFQKKNKSTTIHHD